MVAALACVTSALALAACLPPAPSAGRNTPVRKVTIIGDSITHSNFGVSPKSHEAIRSNLGPIGVSVRFLGYPGDSMYRPWPGQPDWRALIRADVSANNPDVIVLQSINLPVAATKENDATYVQRVGAIFDEAQRRGAHVYLVRHRYSGPTRAAEFDRAQRLQARAATGRGIEIIPVDWWIDRCRGPLIDDGVHLTESGIQCYANALGAAVRQLKDVVG